jgi:hypothetical protein
LTDRHPKIREQALEDGFSQHDPIDMNAFTRIQEAKFYANPPEARMRALNSIDEAISANDGTSMRAKADLFRLRNELSFVHEKLLAARR